MTEEVSTKAAGPIGKPGIRGIPTNAVITLLATSNPKRVGSAAHHKFSLYKTGMTQQEFLDAGGTTPDLVYDSAHRFISVEGYTPKKYFEAKPKKVKAEKPASAPAEATASAKPKKTKKVKGETPAPDAEVESAVQSEMLD